MSAFVIPSNQIRYNDPYTQRIFQYEAPAEQNKYYLAKEVNNLLKLYGDKIFKGLTIKSSSVDSETGNLNVTIEKGVAIVDSTLIFIEEDTVVTYPSVNSLDLSNGFFAVFLNYQWLYTVNDNPLKIAIYYVNSSTGVPEPGFDSSRDKVFVGYIVVDPNDLSTVNYSNVDDHVAINGDVYYVGCAKGEDLEPFESYIDLAMSSERIFASLYNKISRTINIIEKPTIVTPQDGQQQYSGPIEASPFRTNLLFDGTHESSDWEISFDPNFETIVEASYNDAVNLTSYTPTQLTQPDTFYYVRVRYHSDNHVSEYSDPVFFTIAPHIETPQISCDTGDSLYPEFHLSPFTVVGYTDTWLSTNWEIASDENFNNVLRAYTETDPAKKDTWVIDDDLLDINSTYYVRARYNGSEGHSSDWSSTYVLNTGLYKIEYFIPPQENEQTVINIHVVHDNGREFSVSDYSVQATVTQGTILSISGMDVQWQLPSVDDDVTASITIWVIRSADSVEVTQHRTETLTVKNVIFVSDSAVVITNFTEYDYNNGWNVTV